MESEPNQTSTENAAAEPPTSAPTPEAPAQATVRQPAALDAATIALLRQAAAIDWKTIDLDLPRGGYVCAVGGEPVEGKAVLKCDCGGHLVIDLDGESRARCPACKAVFRHALLVQREDMTPSAAADFLDELLTANGAR